MARCHRMLDEAWYNRSYTSCMKTAISIPDPVFEEAEDLARRLRLSRSELYARAVRAYIDAHSGTRIREALDRVYSVEDSQLDPALLRAQLEVLPDEAW